MKDDIGETNDLAAAMPQRAAQMRKRLHDWYQSVDAHFLVEKDGQVPWKPGDAE